MIPLPDEKNRFYGEGYFGDKLLGIDGICGGGGGISNEEDWGLLI